MSNVGPFESNKLSNEHKNQMDTARDERDSALEERDSARTERDDLRVQAMDQKKNSVAQEQFVATLSHDLRNPIAAIKMAIEIIRDAPDEQMKLEMIALIDRNADQAGELINQLLDANLIKSGAKLPINTKMCDLLSILLKCKNALAPQNQKRIILEANSKNEILGVWDPKALERALKNLLSNAIKFSDNGKNVVIEVWQGPDITNVSFHNFGKVISLENQLKIFENHFRVQEDESKTKVGWGLGLTLVKGIAESHGGKVEVTSSLIEGTVFTIRLPNSSEGLRA